MPITHRTVTLMRRKFALLALALGLPGAASAFEQAQAAWHPLVFSKVESWISDTMSPVLTEVNLDAVQRNRNQFDRDEIKQEGGTLTTGSQIGFTLDKREIIVDGKPKAINTQRVIADSK